MDARSDASVAVEEGGRAGRSHRRTGMVLAAAVLVLAAVVAGVTVWTHRDRGAASVPSPLAGDAGDQPARPSSSPAGPQPVLSGITPTEVAEWWNGRWHVPASRDGGTQVVRTVVPETGEPLKLATTPATKERPNEVAHVFCVLTHKGPKVDRKLLQVLVDGCLEPVLRGTEGRDVMTWLDTQDLTAPYQKEQGFPRFKLFVDHYDDTQFSFILNAR